MTRITAAEFESLFFVPTRAMLNWHAIRREKWSSEIRILSDRKTFDKIYLPWTLGTNLMERNAKAIRLSDIPRRLYSLPTQVKRQILKLVGEFETMREVGLMVPAVKRPKRGTILAVDGCHRLAALTLSHQVFRIALFVLEAPANASIIIDLEVP